MEIRRKEGGGGEEKYMMQKTDTRAEWTDAVRNTFSCQNRVCVYVWEKERV